MKNNNIIKIVSLNLLFIALSFTLFSFSKKALFNGVIEYKVEIDSDELDAASKAMLGNLSSKMFISGYKTRIEMDMGMVVNTTITDSKNKEGVILIDVMGQKYAMEMSKEDIEKADKESGTPAIEYTNDSKQIAGYNCKKALVTMNGLDEVLEVYYTEDLSVPENQQFKGLKGFPLEYQINQAGMKMKFTATTVTEKKVEDNLFTIPSGYEKVSKEQLNNLFGGGM
jgi:GLPGLI family protein